MMVLSGGDIVLPDRILTSASLIVEGDRIAAIDTTQRTPSAVAVIDARESFIVPGFVDVHVHGVDGHDSLDGAGAIAEIATRLPRFGVTAFCPTTVACAPDALDAVLEQVARARVSRRPGAARVLPAHLESNFINPEYKGAQPAACLRSPLAALRAGGAGGASRDGDERTAKAAAERVDFTAADILAEIARATPDVGIVTIASELDGGLDLVRWLSARGHRVSLGHSGATYEEALAAIDAGARHATHLFNRMPPLGHRAPGLAGAVLQADEVAAEIICDGAHVHPALIRMAIAAKRTSRIFAITDASAAAGLPIGSRAMLGGLTITAGERTALLPDGTIAGSVTTMDRVFQTLVGPVGLSLVDAATVCATTPARELGLIGHGLLAPEAVADLVILDANFEVVQTYIAGQLVYARGQRAEGTEGTV